MNDMPQPEFQIQRLYIKDISFESPSSPAVFQSDSTPEIKLDIDKNSSAIDNQTYEVVLTLSVTCQNQGQNAFLCEVQQAGVFLINQLNQPQLAHCLGSFCPNILFPYTRELISSLVNRGSFPQLNLSPVNFDALFAAHMERSKLEETHDMEKPEETTDETTASEEQSEVSTEQSNA